MKTCTDCGEAKDLTEFNKARANKDGYRYNCRNCDNKASTKHNRANGMLPMFENKTCASYLGIAVAERLIHHLFKEVLRMPSNNPGFDFICNRDKKIDVKSACITLNYKTYPRWQFPIRGNKTADYFLLLAFNNRADLEPQHQWLIPGNELNKLTGTTISMSTIDKWDEWRQPIGPAVTCCNTIRESKTSRLTKTVQD